MSKAGKTQTMVWLNGAIVRVQDARIDPADRGFTLGDGVFETLAVRAGTALHVDRHLARLAHGAASLGIAWRAQDGSSAIADLIVANTLVDAVLRLTLTRGTGTRGVLPIGIARPTLLATSVPWPAALPAARVITTAATCRNEVSPLSRIKSLNYLDSIVARQDAASKNADDAILLNTEGNVAEATAANLFVKLNGQWLTPPVHDGALPGIARAVLLDHGRAQENRMSQADLAGAEGAALVNSLGARAIIEIDGRTLPPELDFIVRANQLILNETD